MKTDIKKHENGGAKSWIKTHLSDIIPVLGLILVLVFFNAVSGGKVFTKTNFNTLFNEAFSLLIVTYALIFVMAQGKTICPWAALWHLRRHLRHTHHL